MQSTIILENSDLRSYRSLQIAHSLPTILSSPGPRVHQGIWAHLCVIYHIYSYSSETLQSRKCVDGQPEVRKEGHRAATPDRPSCSHTVGLWFQNVGATMVHFREQRILVWVFEHAVLCSQWMVPRSLNGRIKLQNMEKRRGCCSQLSPFERLQSMPWISAGGAVQMRQSLRSR